MKPDWKDAPEWANWLAMNDDGEWYWFEEKPTFDFGEWLAFDDGVWMENDGRVSRATFRNGDAQYTLESRP